MAPLLSVLLLSSALTGRSDAAANFADSAFAAQWQVGEATTPNF